MTLRALEIADLPYLYRWENDAAAWADSSTHNPLSRHLLREYIESTTGDIYKDGQLRLILDNEGETMGCIDLFDLDPLNQRAAIGMYIAPEHRGNGAGHEAIRLLEEYAFGCLHLHQIYAVIAKDNLPCLAIYREAGYTESAPLAGWVRRGEQYVDAMVFQKVSPTK